MLFGNSLQRTFYLSQHDNVHKETFPEFGVKELEWSPDHNVILSGRLHFQSCKILSQILSSF